MHRHSLPVFCCWSPLIAVDCCRLSKRRYYPQVLLQFGHSRSLLVSECEDNKFRREMQVFRGLFFVERKFIFWGVRIYFLRARIRRMGGRILEIHEAIHETINETIHEY